MILILIPVIFFSLNWILFYQLNKSWREAYFKSVITSATTIVVLTESLSFFHILTTGTVALGWILACLFIGWILFPKREKIIFPVPLKISDFSVTEKILIFGFVFIALIVGFIAAYCAPNTWDTMTYHLSRVMHWIQDRSLDHYPTSISRQLAYCIFSELSILQGVILTGTDRFANFVQFFSMIGSWIVASLIASILGANRRAQLFVVLLIATLPMSILQGSSTQTDHVAAFWICSFVYSIFILKNDFSWANSLWAGLSLGLALLTKGYAYVYLMTPFLILFLWSFHSWRSKKLGMMALILCIALALNAGYFMRNFGSFGNCFGPNDGTVSTQMNVPQLAGNVLRNLGSNLGTPFSAVNQELDTLFCGALKKINPSLQLFEFHFPEMSSDEDYAGNPLHTCLIFVSFFIWLFLFRGDSLLRVYTLMLGGMVIMFALGITWQPWITRFQLSFFILACIWMGVIWGRLKSPAVLMIAAVILFAGAQSWLWSGNPRKILGHHSILKQSRIEQYFSKKPYLEPLYEGFSQGVHSMGCTQIGLWLGADDWEYPWWVLLRQDGQLMRLEHIREGQSLKGTYPLGKFDPCVVIGTAEKDVLNYGDYSYSKVVSAQGLSVFVKKSQ